MDAGDVREANGAELRIVEGSSHAGAATATEEAPKIAATENSPPPAGRSPSGQGLQSPPVASGEIDTIAFCWKSINEDPEGDLLPAVGVWCIRGHFHATAIPDGDYAFGNCRDSHKSARDGRSIVACMNGSWSFFIFLKANLLPILIINESGRARIPIFTLNGVEGFEVPFRCKSWRCPKCRPWVFRRDFGRIMTGLESRKRWLFSVVTINQKKWRSGKKVAYKKLWMPCQRLIRQRLARVLGEKVEYISVIEQHLKGWPHVNYALTWRTLEEMDPENVEDYAKAIKRWLKKHAPECGLGWRVSCEPLKNLKATARYFTDKSLGQLGNGPGEGNPGAASFKRFTAEINKTGQLPLEAPIGFRRIRATGGLLPKLRKGDGKWSGCIYDPAKDRERTKGGPGRPGAPVRSAQRGSGGQSPPAPGWRPPAKRAARPKKEQVTAMGRVFGGLGVGMPSPRRRLAPMKPVPRLEMGQEVPRGEFR